MTLEINITSVKEKKMAKIAFDKSKTSIRSFVITIIKKATMPISISSQKTSYNFDNLYIDNCKSGS